MTSKGQCRKLADDAIFQNTEITRFTTEDYHALSDLEIRMKLESTSECSESLLQIIEKSVGVTVILSLSASPAVAEEVINMCGEKLVSICTADESPLYSSSKLDAIIEKYAKYINKINKDDADAFDYYGASSAKVPLLLHKSLTDCGTAIVVSDTSFDNSSGFTGGAGVAFSAFAARKTQERSVTKCFADAESGKVTKCLAGNVKFNPLADCYREAVITSSRAITWFGVSFITDDDGRPTYISAGDLLLSSAYAQAEYMKRYSFNIAEPFSGLLADTDVESLPELASIIERLTPALAKGGRLFINAPNLSASGGDDYTKTFYTSSLHDMYAHIESTGSLEYASAYMLKKLASEYHIVVCSEFDEQTLRQTGLNPAQESAEDFLKNCNKIGYIKNAARFAKQ